MLTEQKPQGTLETTGWIRQVLYPLQSSIPFTAPANEASIRHCKTVHLPPEPDHITAEH